MSPDRACAAGGRCADCDDISCALRALLGRGPATACTSRRPLRLSDRLRIAAARPQVRYRLPTALVVAAAVVSVWGAHGWPLAAWAAFGVATVLGLWWSAPRAIPARWYEIALLAGCIASLAAGGAWEGAWPVTAVAVGLAASRRGRAAAAAVWALSCLSAVVTSAVTGLPLHPFPLAGLTAGAAVGLWVLERRMASHRARQAVAALFDAAR